MAERGQVAEAIAAYRQVIQIRPEFAAAYNNLGDLFRREGRLEEADAALRLRSHSNPTSPRHISISG